MSKKKIIVLCTVTIVAALAISQAPFPQGLRVIGDIIFVERADHSSTPGAGFGYLWTKNTTPSTLVFTDDAGTDFNLGSATFGSSTITSLTQVTPVSGDFIVGTDATDSNALKKFDIADILGAGGGITDGDTLTSGLTFPLAGLHILDTNASHDLILSPGSNLTADRTLTIITGDQDRSLQISGTANVGTGTFTGTNTGDVTLAGTPDYITRSSQVLTLGLVDLTTDVTGVLPFANGGTGATTLAGASIPTYTSTNTFTNKRITKRSGTTTSSATPTINTDNVDVYTLTAQAEDITSFTTNLSGTPVEGDKLLIGITGTAARAITWGASFEAGAVALPTTTITTQRLDVGFFWNSVTSKWRCMAAGPLS